MLEKSDIYHAVRFGDSDPLAEIKYRFGCIAAAAQTAEGRHTRIVPSVDYIILDKVAKVSLRQNGVRDIETGEFDLARFTAYAHIVYYPVVERAVDLVFKRAQRVRDALYRVLDRVSEVVHREDAPFLALTVMIDIPYAVDYRVTHTEVARGEVDLGTECIFSLGEFAGFHP